MIRNTKYLKPILIIIWVTLGLSQSLAEKYSIEVGQFQKLKVNGNLNVVYKNIPDSTGYAFYEAPVGSSGLFDVETKKDGLLKVAPSDSEWGKDNLPVLYVYSDFLTSVESYSENSVEVSDLAACASFNVNLVGNGTITVDGLKCNNVTASISTGNGTIYLSGTCESASYRMIGTGLISADQLQALNVNCKILGTGSIGCWPIDNLKVVGLGSTKIYYKGTPNIKKTGGGKLFELPDETVRIGTEVRSLNAPDEDE